MPLPLMRPAGYMWERISTPAALSWLRRPTECQRSQGVPRRVAGATGAWQARAAPAVRGAQVLATDAAGRLYVGDDFQGSAASIGAATVTAPYPNKGYRLPGSAGGPATGHPPHHRAGAGSAGVAQPDRSSRGVDKWPGGRTGRGRVGRAGAARGGRGNAARQWPVAAGIAGGAACRAVRGARRRAKSEATS